MTWYQGHLLVASPHLPDPNFYRSVVLMIQHDESGAVGLILNRPTDCTADDFWDLPAREPTPTRPRPIYLGGPVSDQVTAIHANKQLSEGAVIPGVYVSTRCELLEEIAQSDEFPALLFTGYAGWAGGQLEHELAMGGWLTKPTTAEEIFAEHDDVWKAVVEEIGFEILAPSIKRGSNPVDPSMN